MNLKTENKERIKKFIETGNLTMFLLCVIHNFSIFDVFSLCE